MAWARNTGARCVGVPYIHLHLGFGNRSVYRGFVRGCHHCCWGTGADHLQVNSDGEILDIGRRRVLDRVAARALVHLPEELANDAVALELHGKTLVDRFRVDAATIYTALSRRTTLLNAKANRALALVAIFAASAISVLVFASLIFAVQQHKFGLRLEEQRARGERERRKSAEIRSAYEAEKRLADTLQEALFQEDFPDLPTLSFSATYVPASEEAKIGGDWYDAVQLPDGRVLLAIGDVTGHGIEAVVAMSRARQLLIRSALLDADPATILKRANVELIKRKSPFITAIIAVVDTRSFAFTYAVAGHPPPWSRASRTTSMFVGSGGTSCSGAATTTMGCTTPPRMRTTRCNMTSSPNGSQAFDRPMRLLWPPHRMIPPTVVIGVSSPGR